MEKDKRWPREDQAGVWASSQAHGIALPFAHGACKDGLWLLFIWISDQRLLVFAADPKEDFQKKRTRK